MEFYRRHLPHIHPPQATFFITFRLNNSLPQWILDQLKEEFNLDQLLQQNNRGLREDVQRRYFDRFDQFLDAQKEGNRWLKDPSVASIVTDAIHHRDGRNYSLLAYCIMPNHVHLLIRISDEHRYSGRVQYTRLTSILQSLKSYTAIECNKVLGRDGQFWQMESYDRVIRDEAELERTILYIIYNPVSAGFVSNWRQWKFTYCCYDIE